jgi:Na+/H+-dicarboxylate symporter
MKWWNKQQLYVQIFIGIVLGLIIGFTVGGQVSFIMKPIGDVFLRLLMMLIAPVVLFTIVSGITKMEDVKSLTSVGGKLLIYYTLTSVIAMVVAMVIGIVIDPGKDTPGLLSGVIDTTKASKFSFVDNMIKWVPVNPFEALATGNVLQILFFSVFLGIALLLLRDKVKFVTQVIDQGAEVMLKITDMVMSLAPYGILALVSEMVHSLSAKTLAEVGKFIAADTLAMLALLILVYPIQLKLMAGISPTRFYKAITPAILIAASTTSSAASLPVNLNVAEKNLKLPEKIYGFGLTVGATINSNGMAAALGVICIFAANLFGMNLTLPMLFQFGLVGVLSSMGTAGVKGAGVVLSAILLQTMGLPLTLIPILAAIWPVIDIAHTTCNVVGDMVGVSIISAKAGEMDVKAFNENTVHEYTNAKAQSE